MRSESENEIILKFYLYDPKPSDLLMIRLKWD